ncbi:MAG: ABC transporter substrate-binding protein [Deltaproteobacteria bacterium]|nr:ABC transporter substrate-binding protein [Deltaproteobacteria bacterium]
MKARIALLAFLAAWMPLASQGSEPGESKTITFSVGGGAVEFDFWEQLMRDFQAETGIDVELMRKPMDTGLHRQSLVVPLSTRKSDPDVFLMDVAWLAQFAASRWLTPLGPYLAKGGCGDRNAFFPHILALADTYEGDLVALPVFIDGGLLYYRTDLLRKYGLGDPPRTLDELLRYAQKVQKGERLGNPGFFAFVWQGAQYEGLICDFLEFAGSDGSFTVKDGSVSVDTPENRKALRFMHDLIHLYGVSPPNTYTEMKEEEVRRFFQGGNALFERNWPYAFALHEAEGSPVRGKTAIAPVPSFTPGHSVSTLGGWHVGISRFSDAKTESYRLLCFLTSYEVQKKMALHLGWNPGRKDVYDDPAVLDRMPHFRNLRAVFENARPRPIVPYYTQLSEILQRHLNAALSGKSPPGEALATAQKQMQAIVSRYHRK